MERRSPKTRRRHIAGEFNAEFRRAGQDDGTILWHTSATFSSPLPAINVEAGTLKGGTVPFGFFLDDSPITVAAGATLDLAGNRHSTSFTNLLGGGAVIDSGAALTLTLEAANFSGAIAGPLSLVANGTVILSGNNTYTGTTTIDSGCSFELGLGGATGSIGGGAISDGGALSIDRSNALTLTNAISGGGILDRSGRASRRSTPPTLIPAARTFRPERSPSAMAARWEPARSP